MVILGLGSNLGDKLCHLRQAFKLLQAIPGLTILQVSPIYISDALLPDEAPAEWNIPYLNLALRCVSTLDPLTLLQAIKNIEFLIMGRKPEKRWGPRIIDIDILAWDDLIQYTDKLHIPHEHLHERPFALWPLADVAPHWIYPLPGSLQGKTAAEIAAPWGSRFSGQGLFHTRQIAQRIETAQIVGIINLAPDSFSDGGQFINDSEALAHAESLMQAGAEILDIGAEATGPDVQPIASALEWKRLASFLKKILAMRQDFLIPPKISIDTRHAAVAKKALDLGVDWINDVSGLADPEMCELIQEASCDVVVMHHLGIPVNKQIHLPPHQDPVQLIYQWAETHLNNLEKKGIPKKRVILDVGNGYGKTREQSFALMQRINEFHSLDTRLLVGHSRKVFLTLFTPHAPADRDLETALFSVYLSRHNVRYLRVHHPELCARSLKVDSALHGFTPCR